MRLSRITLCTLISALCLGGAIAAEAQANAASSPTAGTSANTAKAAVTGTVSDQEGKPVGGATVTIQNASGSRSTTTDEQGQYALMDLAPGSYNIVVMVKDSTIFQASVSLSPAQLMTLGIAGSLANQQNLASPSQASPPAATSPALAASTQPSTPAPAESPAPAAAPAVAAPEQSGPSAPLTEVGATVQVGPNEIGGTVTDQTGAVVANAKVETRSASGQVETTTSDERGNFLVKNLSPGVYKLTVSVRGFKDSVLENLNVSGAQALPSLDVMLQPAGETTEVKVESERLAQVETENAEVSGTITQKEVQNYQLNGRNFSQLIALAPGVSNQTGQDEAKVGVKGSVKYSVNGGRVEYNTFEVDGGDILNAGLNGAESTLMVYPSLDAIQEVKVLTSNYGAMYGRTASGTVLVSTKSGGAAWHGNAYEFLRNEAFNARNYFDQTKSAPLYRRNDFGFTIGGPVSIPRVYNPNKDKTFVFWSEEFRLEHSPDELHPDFNHGVPSAAERSGDFNDVCPAYNPASGQFGGLFKPSQWPDCPSAARSPDLGYNVQFPFNNIVSANGFTDPFGGLDPNALALLSTNLIPLPNSNTGCNSSVGSCYDAVISEPTYWREELFRLDHNISSKLRSTIRYIHDSWDTTVPVPQWGYVVNTPPTVENRFIGPGTNIVASFTDTINPTLINQFTASYSNSHITLTNVNGPGGANYLRPSGLGQPGGPCTTTMFLATSCPMGTIFSNGFGGKAPGVIIGGNNLAYGGAGFNVDTSYMPWEHTNPIWSYRDDVTKSLGKHLFQFGFQFVFADKNETNGAIGANTGDIQGLLTFSNINGGVGNTGNAFANFLTLFSTGSINAIQSFTQDSAQGRFYERYRIGEPYIQDDWKVTPKLTLNLGLRLSLFGVYHEKYLDAYNWAPSTFDPALAAQVRVDSTTGQLISRPQQTPIPIDLNNLDPRITNGLVQCGINHVPQGCMTGHVVNPAPRVGFAWDPFGNGRTSIRGGYGIFFEHGTGQESNTGSLEGSAPYVLNMTQRFPSSYGCIGGSAGALDSCAAQPGAYPLSVTAIPTKAVWPYAQQWSFGVQRELQKDMMASFAYVGSKGTHLTVERQLNQLQPVSAAANPFGPNEPIIPQPTALGVGDCSTYIPPQSGAPGGFVLLNGTVVGPQNPAYVNLEAACAGENQFPYFSTPNVDTLRPYPGLGEIFSLQNVADSSYHALQATLRHSRGPLTVNTSYTYSHSIDDSSDRSDATFVNSYDLRSNRASSNFDERHLLSVGYIYTLSGLNRWLQGVLAGQPGDTVGEGESPTMPGEPSRLLKAVADGWQISGITVFQSGTPFSVINGGSSTISVLDNAGVANGVGAGSYPDVVADPRAHAPLAGNNFRSFGPILGNPNAFAAPRGLTFGDAGRNFLNNPGRLNFDFTLMKLFQVREANTLEFRAEAFNVFNHTQFRIYNPDLGNTGSNVISCYGGPNYTAGYYEPGGTNCLTGNAFLHPVDAHRARTLQLALKYSF